MNGAIRNIHLYPSDPGNLPGPPALTTKSPPWGKTTFGDQIENRVRHRKVVSRGANLAVQFAVRLIAIFSSALNA